MKTAKYRQELPQLSTKLFLTDGGLETTLIFHDHIDLPDYAAFALLKSAEGEAALRRYFRSYAQLARRFKTGLILESATWRASRDWGTRLGYTPRELAHANRQAILLLEEIRKEFEDIRTKIVISGCIGPRADEFDASQRMSAPEAEEYHREQIHVFATTHADMVCALTMSYVEEAIGIAEAAKKENMPVAISFTVETDGRLPTRESLKSAILEVEKRTRQYPVYYMIDCAHATHFADELSHHEPWGERLCGIRAHASQKSRAELKELAAPDAGNPKEFGMEYATLKQHIKHLNVLGGCCGTDHRHIEQIALWCSELFP